jgi:phage-related protein
MLNLQAIGRLGSAVVGTLAEAWRANGNEIATGIKSLISSFADLTVAIFERFYPAFRFVVNGITTLWSMFGDEISAVFGVIIKGLGEILQNFSFVVDALTNIIEGDFSGALNSMEKILDNSIAFFKDLLDGLLQYFINIGLIDAALTLVTGFQTAFISGFNQLYNNVVGILEGIVNTVIDTFDVLPSEITDKIGFSIEDGIDLPERTTSPTQIQQESQGRTEEIKVVLDEKTDVVEARIEEGAERAIQGQKRRTTRNTGGTTGL